MVSLASVLPPAALAQGEQSREALLTALAMNECSVTEGETPTVFGSQGFGPEYVRRELGQMVLDETAFLEGGRVLRVPPPHCPPADPVSTPAQAFRSMIEEEGCSIDDAAARALGIDVARMRPVVQSWIDSGAATIEGRTLTLRDCG